MIVIVEALDGGLFDGSVHSLDLPISPRVFHFGEAVLNAIFPAHTFEDVLKGIAVSAPVGELDAVICEYRMQFVWHRCDHIAQELRRSHFVGRRMEFSYREFGCPVDGYEEIELALGSLDLGNVDMKVTDRIALEPLLGRLVPLHLG